MIVHFNNNSKFWMDERSNFTDIYIIYIIYYIYIYIYIYIYQRLSKITKSTKSVNLK